MIQNYTMYWGRIHGDPVSTEEISPFELIVETEKGDIVLYNDINHTLRRLPKDCDVMSEEECKKEFRYNLKKLLYTNDMTQQELSEVTGIDGTLISKYANGKSLPGFYNLDKIAKALNCSADDFRYTYKK